MPATSLDLSQIKTDALASASAFRALIGLGTLSTQSPTGTPSASTFLRGDFSWQTIDLSGYVPYSGATGAVNLGSNAFTASRATLATGTITTSNPILNLSQTWNNAATTFTGILADCTDTASATDSMLMNLRVGGTSRFRVRKDGAVELADNSYTLFTGAGTVGLTVRNSNSNRVSLNFRGASIRSDGAFSWSTSTDSGSGSYDLILERDAAGTLGIRNSTNAQTFRIYNTFTDASNYERVAIASATYSSARYFTLSAESAGTGAADLNMVIAPKGNGALIAELPDGTSAGGNARGTHAVDLQLDRANAADVASGSYSGVLSGISNRASGAYAVVGGGVGNTASGSHAIVGGGGDNNATGFYATVGGGAVNNATDYATIGGGTDNTASGGTATIGGGEFNTASFFCATIGGGSSNTATNDYATIGGGVGNTASGSNATVGGGGGNTALGSYATIGGGVGGLADRHAMQAYSAGFFANQGDAQSARFVLRRKTVNNTATTLMLDGNSTRLTIPSGKVLAFTAKIAGVKSDGTSVAFFVRKGAIKNVGGTTSLAGTIETIGTDIEDNASTDVAITADDTNDALQINVTGIASETWRWVAVVEGVEIGYGT